MLGHKLVQKLKNRFDVYTTIKGKLADHEKFGIFEKYKTIENLNVEDDCEVKKIVNSINPEIVFNAVGIIKQLPTSKNVITTLAVNSIFPHKLAQFCGETGAKLINISTDCVFDGIRGNYSENDAANAIDLYGKSKNFGEVVEGNCLTLRTSIIGRELKTSHSLVEWFLSNRNGKVKGFKNAIYSGLPTVVLADIIADLIDRNHNLNGLYHISSEPINKFDLLQLINKAFRANVQIERDEEFKIDRSLNSEKFRKETGFKPKSWEEMVEIMANDTTPYDYWRQ